MGGELPLYDRKSMKWPWCSSRPVRTWVPDLPSGWSSTPSCGARNTADDRTVEVSIKDDGRERVRRSYVAPRLTDVDLLELAVEEGAADPIAVHALATARRLLGVESDPQKAADRDSSHRTSVRSQDND